MTNASSPFKLPRGIRNNNPGNIRRDGDAWQGLLPRQTDPDFCQFSTPEMGLRALMIILLKYNFKYGLDTVQSIINRWAPPIENDTGAYQREVAKVLRVSVDQTGLRLNNPMLLARLAGAIVVHENGAATTDRPTYWFGDDVYAAAAKMALKAAGFIKDAADV